MVSIPTTAAASSAAAAASTFASSPSILPSTAFHPPPHFGQQQRYGRPQQQPLPWIPSNAPVASLSHGGLWGGTPFFPAQMAGGALPAQSESSLQPSTVQSETKAPVEEKEDLSTPPRAKRTSSLLRTPPPHTLQMQRRPLAFGYQRPAPHQPSKMGWTGGPPPFTSAKPLRFPPSPCCPPKPKRDPAPLHRPHALLLVLSSCRLRLCRHRIQWQHDRQASGGTSGEEKLPPIAAPLCSKSASGASPVPSAEAEKAGANRRGGEGREKVLEEEDEWIDEILDDEPRHANLPYTFSPPSQQLALNQSSQESRIAERGGQRKKSVPTAQQSVFGSEPIRAKILDFALQARHCDPLLFRLRREGIIPPCYCNPHFECVRLGDDDRESWKLEIDGLLYGGRMTLGKWGCDLGAEGLVGVRRRGNTEHWARPVFDTKSGDRVMQSRIRERRWYHHKSMTCIQRGEVPLDQFVIQWMAENPEEALKKRRWPWMDEELEVCMNSPEKSLLWWKTHKFEKGEAVRLNMRGVFAPPRMRTRFPPDRPLPVIPPEDRDFDADWFVGQREDLERAPLFSAGFLFRCVNCVSPPLADAAFPSLSHSRESLLSSWRDVAQENVHRLDRAFPGVVPEWVYFWVHS
uniref:Uncharacterized protein n=1 Tax=Chromera velia CCMP2878 TaxID=1169474 RepID=A0A0G4HWV6_9ALVE|eukprot:Cvel_9115.t1-p1 / transcript=Cvel_9115.t1 / gene=Cvel_9115 / organism=Chromera_velia_CCMP2878 / gene_product=hypothetical protein / transcript_product=hypothetical protein / location=Cvel_scaffold517:69507-71791(+) / protein_length=630 / sequence_SO=supercontig / SO=protein_coding / is_pseudo=false